MEKDEYEKAWAEDDNQDTPIEHAVTAAQKKAKDEKDDEYLAAMAELDDEEKKKASK